MKATSRASKKYDEKMGLVTKSVKVPQNILKTFKYKVSYNRDKESYVITRLMELYIDRGNELFIIHEKGIKCSGCGIDMSIDDVKAGNISKLINGKHYCNKCAMNKFFK